MTTTQHQREILSQIDPRALERAVYAFDDRRRKILSQRLIREEPKTLRQLGKELSISKERVRQIQSESFEKVRHLINDTRHSI